MSILVVISEGLFSHAYADEPVYIVDLDEHATDPVKSAIYDPDSDCQMPVNLEEIDSRFGTEFEAEYA